MISFKTLVVAVSVVCSITPIFAAEPSSLATLQFLLGEWDGIGSGKPGEATGGATFASALQGRVITRTSHADYPAVGDRPASHHEDLMVIHVDVGSQVKADYYDSEGHVIRYAVRPGEGGAVVFTSDPSASAPRFRLTYKPAADGALSGQFEIAPPGKPEAFAPYLSWISHKVNAAGARPK